MPNISDTTAMFVDERRVDILHGSIFVREAPGDGPAVRSYPSHMTDASESPSRAAYYRCGVGEDGDPIRKRGWLQC